MIVSEKWEIKLQNTLYLNSMMTMQTLMLISELECYCVFGTKENGYCFISVLFYFSSFVFIHRIYTLNLLYTKIFLT